MKNVYILPTNKPSRLWINNLRRRFELDEFSSQHPNNIAKHIYITSDEEIKLNDYVIQINFKKTNIEIIQCITKFQVKIANDKNGSFTKEKVILTTDQDLIKDGVQAIDDEFLQWLVKNPNYEKVIVEKICNNCGDKNCVSLLCKSVSYKIVIPKEKTIKINTCYNFNKEIGCVQTECRCEKEETKYPIGGYAPGNYFCIYVSCKTQFQGDKKATQCEACAVEMLKKEIIQNPCNNCGKNLKEQMKGCNEITCYRQLLNRFKNTSEILFELKQKLNNAIQKSNPLFPNYKALSIKDETQKTLEEAAERFLKEGAREAKTAKQVLIEFYKEQQEKMYSVEEVKQIIDKTLIEYSDYTLADIPNWFEQFKKK